MSFDCLQIPWAGKRLISLLNELKDIGNYKLMMSASKEMARQKVLHQMWAKNNINVQKINQLRKEIDEELNKTSEIGAEKREEIKIFEAEKQRLIEKHTVDLNRLM